MRFVVLEIPDNDEAEALIKAVQGGMVLFGRLQHPETPEVAEYAFEMMGEGWEVPQVYAVPTKFCECPDYNGVSARSSKYGWWVHAKCSKPRPGAMQHPFNLLERHKPGEEVVYYMGFRADRRPYIIPKES